MANERIFISYKRKNKEQVFSLIEKIERELGVKCWVDLDGIESNAQFVSKICNAIDRAEVVLFMHSMEHSRIEDLNRDWTIRELNYADAKRKRTVLVKLDDAPLDNYFLLVFGAQNNIDPRVPEQWNNLLRDLRKWLDLEDEVSAPPKQYTSRELSSLIEKGNEYYRFNQYEKALECYLIVGNHGNAGVQGRIGDMYYWGQGVGQNYAEAARWYRRSAEQGYAWSQNNLACMCFSGQGVQKDKEEARRWFQKAAAQGHEGAQQHLSELY